MELDEIDWWLLTEADEWDGVALGADQPTELDHADELVHAGLLCAAEDPPDDDLHYFDLTDEGEAVLASAG